MGSSLFLWNSLTNIKLIYDQKGVWDIWKHSPSCEGSGQWFRILISRFSFIFDKCVWGELVLVPEIVETPVFYRIIIILWYHVCTQQELWVLWLRLICKLFNACDLKDGKKTEKLKHHCWAISVNLVLHMTCLISLIFHSCFWPLALTKGFMGKSLNSLVCLTGFCCYFSLPAYRDSPALQGFLLLTAALIRNSENILCNHCRVYYFYIT